MHIHWFHSRLPAAGEITNQEEMAQFKNESGFSWDLMRDLQRVLACLHVEAEGGVHTDGKFSGEGHWCRSWLRCKSDGANVCPRRLEARNDGKIMGRVPQLMATNTRLSTFSFQFRIPVASQDSSSTMTTT